MFYCEDEEIPMMITMVVVMKIPCSVFVDGVARTTPSGEVPTTRVHASGPTPSADRLRQQTDAHARVFTNSLARIALLKLWRYS